MREAHALWRGPLLADLTDVAPIAVAVEGCVRLHREVTDALVAASAAAGRSEEVLGLAAASVAADPLREPAVLALIRALAASGQAPEALRVGREYRRRLADETGLDPSPALAELEREVAGGASGPAPARPEPPPRSATRLLGRAAEVAALHRMLAAERLVSVVGPGGVGKTRVAVEVADRSETVAVLLLAPITEPAAIGHALAAALNLRVVQGDVLAACLAVLDDRPGLLVIDNCEHLLAAVRDVVGTVLSACPRLSVLTTSREPLALAAEYVYRLAPLPLPGSGPGVADVPSVAVFLDRAARVRPDFRPTPADLATVAEIVRRLDGMPLAIELAAGRLSTFSLTDLRDRLDRSLDLLAGGRPSGDTRHRTLRATVEWSYQLLGADEQRLFRHLSVFVDGVDLDTAEQVAGDLGLADDPGSVLARLVDASMIDSVFTDRTRYRMLETLRAFGLDRLAAAGETSAAQQQLVRWAVGLIALDRHDREHRARARGRRRAAPRAAQPAGRVAAGPRRRIARRRRGDGPAADRGDRLPRPDRDPGLGRGARRGSGARRPPPGRPRCWAPRRRPPTTVATTAGPTGSRGPGSTERPPPTARGSACCRWPRPRWPAGSSPRPSTSWWPRPGTRRQVRDNLWLAALGAAYGGDLDRARTLNDRGGDGAVAPSMLAWSAYTAGEIESAAGHVEVAEQHYERAIDLARSSGATFLVGVATVGLLAVQTAAGRIHDALRGYREVIDYFARTGNWTHQWTTLRNLAELLRRLGDDEPAGLLDAAADAAPDAPVREPRSRAGTGPAPPIIHRAAVLDVARQAIERNLSRG